MRELAIQLRKLQSENIAQASEIDRLERQIKILSELKGVSLNELREALREACEGEAHKELQSIVGKLQARLDGLDAGNAGGLGLRRARFGQLKDQEVGAHGKAEKSDDFGADDALNQIPSQDRFNEEAASRAKAALELRISELLELEANLRGELASLYQHSEKLTSRNTFLETQNLQQKAHLDEWERRWREKEDDDIRKGSLEPVALPSGVSCGSYNYAEFARNSANVNSNEANGVSNAPPPPPVLLLHNEPQAKIDWDREQRLLAAETAMAGEKQKRKLLQSQFDAAKKSYDLKLEQYESRLKFQQGQITDLEQQLSSLYAAFGIVQSDRKEESHQKEGLKTSLLQSDAALAKEAYEKEKKMANGGGEFNSTGQIVNTQANAKVPPKKNSLLSYPRGKSSTQSLHHPGSDRSISYASAPPTTPPPSAVKPAYHPAIAQGHLLLLLDSPSRLSLTASSSHSSSFSSRKRFFKSNKSSQNTQSSTPSAPKFRKQYCVLHGANGLYQLRYGDTYLGAVSGVLEFITTGVSSIEHTDRSSTKSYGFEIMINAQDEGAPVLCCAAESEQDFMMWMTALMVVMDQDGGGASRINQEEVGSAPSVELTPSPHQQLQSSLYASLSSNH